MRSALLGVLLGAGACQLALGDGNRATTNPANDDAAARRKFVSTKESAAKLNGMPGMACEPAQEKAARADGLQGPCWDPPGATETLAAAHLEAGMRQLHAPDFTAERPEALYWFDMPREAVESDDGKARLPSYRERVEIYEPYGRQGFAVPALPAVTGKPLAAALAALDALDLPFAVAVRWESCAGADSSVCKIDWAFGGQSKGRVDLVVAQRVRYRGTDREERELPAGLEGRPTDEVVAELKQLGFTVDVIEKDLPCNRGVVCSVPGNATWRKTRDPVELWVRRRKAP